MVSVVRLSILNVVLSLAVFVPFNADRPTDAADGQTKVTVLGSFTRQSEAHLLPMEFRKRLEQTDMTSSLHFSFFLCGAIMWP